VGSFICISDRAYFEQLAAGLPATPPAGSAVAVGPPLEPPRAWRG
jgi:hypothetical protein